MVPKGTRRGPVSASDLASSFYAIHHPRKGQQLLDHAHALGVYLLFEADHRPSAAAITAFAAAWEAVFVSHDPSTVCLHDSNTQDLAKLDEKTDTGFKPLAKHWVELLRDGLTYDLQGLAPGPACVCSQAVHRFDWPGTGDFSAYEALHLTIGPHLQGGQRSLPVLRTMAALARDLTLFFEEIVAVVWTPSRSVIGRRFFESTTTAWLDGGPFPALGLTAFAADENGALETVGLELWIDQELRIDAALASDRLAATRLGVRLVNHVLLLGGLTHDERVTAPDGTPLVMKLSPDRKHIMVMRE